MVEHLNIANILKKTFIFEELSSEQIELVSIHAKPIHLRNGEFLCQEGDAADSMWIMFEGEAVVKKNIILIEKGNLATGKKIFFKLKAEDYPCIGENGIFHNNIREASIKCTMDSKFLQFKREQLLKVINDDKDAGLKILLRMVQVLNSRLRSVNKDVLKLTTALSLALEK